MQALITAKHYEGSFQVMKADKGQFDAVLKRLLEKPPQKTADIHRKKAEAKKVKSSPK